jgi:hypothetical protein
MTRKDAVKKKINQEIEVGLNRPSTLITRYVRTCYELEIQVIANKRVTRMLV